MFHEFYNGKVTTESEHACVLDREYPGALMGCSCGKFWMAAGRDIRRMAFVSYELCNRLREYQADVRWGRRDSIADAVRAVSPRARLEALHPVLRAAAAAKARDDWHRLQAAKRAKWWRCVRLIILSRPCAYCGGTATAIDHVIPWSRGGAYQKMSNLAPSCNPCNAEKSNRTPEEWKAWRLRRGRPWPPLPRENAA